jgi:hypothetical protein
MRAMREYNNKPPTKQAEFRICIYPLAWYSDLR